MNANSPSWVSEKPQRMLVLSGWPESITPREVKITFAGNERYCQGNNCKQAAANYGRVYHHADGYEEDAGKQILYRLKQNLGAARVNRS